MRALEVKGLGKKRIHWRLMYKRETRESTARANTQSHFLCWVGSNWVVLFYFIFFTGVSACVL